MLSLHPQLDDPVRRQAHSASCATTAQRPALPLAPLVADTPAAVLHIAAEMPLPIRLLIPRHGRAAGTLLEATPPLLVKSCPRPSVVPPIFVTIVNDGRVAMEATRRSSVDDHRPMIAEAVIVDVEVEGVVSPVGIRGTINRHRVVVDVATPVINRADAGDQPPRHD